MFETLDPDAAIYTRPGREFPYATFGQWVIFADIPAHSKLLYCLLRAHVNGRRGDNLAWPTQTTLAGLMRLKKATDVGKYTKPLVEVGAVDIETVRFGERRMLKRIVYTVHEAPPEGYAGPASIQDYYKNYLAKPQVAPDIPWKGGPDISSKGGPNIPPKGYELKEQLQKEEELQKQELKEGAAAPLPVLGRSAPCGPGRLALELPGSPQDRGPGKTRVVNATHHTRGRARAGMANRHEATIKFLPVRPPRMAADALTPYSAGDHPEPIAVGQTWPEHEPMELPL